MGVSLSRSEFPGKGSRAKLHTEPLFSYSSLFSLERTGRDLSRSPSPTESRAREFMLVHATSPLAPSFLPCLGSRNWALLRVLDSP